MPLDANVRTDVGWIRRLAGGTANALARVQAYVERGEGEAASRGGLAAKFGRAKFFTEEFFPYALYYLGLLTFESPFRLGIPNLTIRNMFVDYYDELSEFRNEDEARRHFGRAAEDLALDGGTWRGVRGVLAAFREGADPGAGVRQDERELLPHDVRVPDVGLPADVLLDRDGVQHAGGPLRLPRGA